MIGRQRRLHTDAITCEGPSPHLTIDGREYTLTHA